MHFHANADIYTTTALEYYSTLFSHMQDLQYHIKHVVLNQVKTGLLEKYVSQNQDLQHK